MSVFFSLLYPCFYALLLMLSLPSYLYQRMVGRQPLGSLRQRMGFYPPAAEARGPRVWIHSVSVGEVQVIKPLVEVLSLEPGQLFLSTTTATGQALARSLYRQNATVFYFPLDWGFCCRRFLDSIRPDVVVLTESEIWPTFIRLTARRGIALVLANGRVSDRSFRRSRRARFLFQPVLEHFTRLCVQSRQDRDRFLHLGAPADRVSVMGNLKYDYQLAPDPARQQLVTELQQLLKPNGNELLWVCGSTREKEEEMLLSVFLRLRQEFPQLRLLLAPRHPHRTDEVSKMLEQSELSFQRRSQLSSVKYRRPPQVLLLDSIGDLAYLYQLADIVFIGGSLIPWGGHNVIEAANFKKPILFGPHMQNFHEVAAVFLSNYGALQVSDCDELEKKITTLLRDPATRRWLGQNARKVIRDNQGAVERTVEVIQQQFPS